jgi:hypothetical protein
MEAELGGSSERGKNKKLYNTCIYIQEARTKRQLRKADVGLQRARQLREAEWGGSSERGNNNNNKYDIYIHTQEARTKRQLREAELGLQRARQAKSLVKQQEMEGEVK